MNKAEGIKVIQSKAGTQFDPRVVAALVAIHNGAAFDAVGQGLAGETNN
jgi:HD-GYP domain-containing protein (c-di-GMP phosphodiesterase class II)